MIRMVLLEMGWELWKGILEGLDGMGWRNRWKDLKGDV
jgi:hypothetical protein